MAIYKVEPFRGFERMFRHVGELMNDIDRGGIRFEVGDFTPRVDISETETELAIQAELPGMTKDDIKITVSEDNVLNIRGEKKRETKTEEKNFMRVERSYGSFSRSFTLPGNLRTENISAKFDNGVLNLMIPKMEPIKPKELQVEIG